MAGLLTLGASPAERLELTIEGLRSADGVVQICVSPDPDYFPHCRAHPSTFRERPRAAEAGTVRLEGLPSGNYAVALIHDENGNGELDRFAGIPREGMGFSRNPRFSFGPPSFSAARFRVEGGRTQQSIRMRYFL